MPICMATASLDENTGCWVYTGAWDGNGQGKNGALTGSTRCPVFGGRNGSGGRRPPRNASGIVGDHRPTDCYFFGSVSGASMYETQ